MTNNKTRQQTLSTANGPALGNAMAGPGLWGIDAPYELKRDVWSMKRGQVIIGRVWMLVG